MILKYGNPAREHRQQATQKNHHPSPATKTIFRSITYLKTANQQKPHTIKPPIDKIFSSSSRAPRDNGTNVALDAAEPRRLSSPIHDRSTPTIN